MDPYLINSFNSLNTYIPHSKEVQKEILDPSGFNAYFGLNVDSSLQQSQLFRYMHNLYGYYKKAQLELIGLKLSYTSVTSYMNDYNNITDIVKKMCGNPRTDKSANSIVIAHISKGFAIFDLVKESPTYNKNVSIALQTEQTHRISVIKNGDYQTVIFTNKLDDNILSQIYSTIPILFDITEVPQELVDSYLGLYNKDYDTIINNLKVLTDKFDFSEIQKQRLVATVGKMFDSSKTVQKVDREIKDKEAAYESCIREATTYMTKVRALQLKKLSYLNQNNDEQKNMLIEYIIKNKYISDINGDMTYLYFTVETPVFFIDEELLERYLKTDRGYINSYDSQHGTKINQMFKDVFLNKKYTMWTRAKLSINIQRIQDYILGAQGGNVSADVLGAIYRQEYYEEDYKGQQSISQPHIVHFNCFGNNKTPMLQAIRNDDYIGLIAQIIAACQNINFGDSTVGQRMVELITKQFKDNKFLEDNETHERISYTEYVKRIGAQTNETNNA